MPYASSNNSQSEQTVRMNIHGYVPLSVCPVVLAGRGVGAKLRCVCMLAAAGTAVCKIIVLNWL